MANKRTATKSILEGHENGRVKYGDYSGTEGDGDSVGSETDDGVADSEIYNNIIYHLS